MIRKSFACMVALIISLASGIASPGNAEARRAPTYVLFIGNSYTQFNDLHRVVSEMGWSLGYDIRTDEHTVGGASFADHWRSPEARKKIASRKWGVVVLQDHSLAPGLKPRDVWRLKLPYARALAALVKESHAATKIVYYETWGRRDGVRGRHCWSYPGACTFHGHTRALRTGYRIYQRATGGDIAPVGSNWWRIVHDRRGVRPFKPRALWVRDGSHPSRLGSYLAAGTILRTIIRLPVSGSRYTAGLPEGTARYILQVVDAP